jgi:hypothetical protein
VINLGVGVDTWSLWTETTSLHRTQSDMVGICFKGVALLLTSICRLAMPLLVEPF